MPDFVIIAKRVSDRIEELGALTDESGVLYRSFLSPAMAQANKLVASWLAKIPGCQVHVDSWGNLIGHIPGDDAADSRVLVVGSHLDTVRNAGKYDGMLGVLVALASMEAVIEFGVSLPFAVEIVGWSDEEGARFQHAYLGSKAYSGLVTEADLTLKDKAGVTLGEAVSEFQGLASPKDLLLPKARYSTSQMLGYVEVHIEQGPVLESQNLPLGVVTSIAAQTRLRAVITGKAGHAGTTPMNLRQDALAAAAECILVVEQTGNSLANLVATVGQLEVSPSVSNVIPGGVIFSIDVRHPSLETVEKACAQIQGAIAKIVNVRGLKAEVEIVQQNGGVTCAPHLIAALEEAVLAQQTPVPKLISGAGHDGIILSKMTDVAMLFVRSRDGLSHHPDEFTEQGDIQASITALTKFLMSFKPSE